MDKKIILTMDIEPDLTKYITDSYYGIKIIPQFLDLLDKYDVKCDFFITANVLMEHSEILKQLVSRGHILGNHGSNHCVDYYCLKNYKWQEREITKSTVVINKYFGRKPTMFRAPNFSANGDTIKVLEKNEYLIDSSVLPGRRVKKLKMLPIYDFREASVEPYNPSKEDISKIGNSRVLEIPLTENPLLRGAPVGVGYLNNYGIDKTISIIEGIEREYITFLLHPWELVDLGKKYPNLPESWKRGCRNNFGTLENIIKYFKKNLGFTNLGNVYDSYR